MKFCLIDTNNLVHRVKRAIKDQHVNTSFDECVRSTLTVVFHSMKKAFNRFKADHCVACFDSWSWRKGHYAEYKANRDRSDFTEEQQQEHEIIITVLRDLKEFLDNYTNVTVLEERGIEADDFIARWVQLHSDECFQHVIISTDVDFRQLVSGNVELFNPILRVLYTKDGILYQDSKPNRFVKIQIDQLDESGQPVLDEKGKIKKIDSKVRIPVVHMYDEEWKVRLDKRGDKQTFDPEWELFYKIIRGDQSDNIKSAFPRVYETRLRKAFADRGGKEWNNLLNDTFLLGDDRHPVRPLYERNKLLIDLRQQPEDIVKIIETRITEAISKKRKKLVQVYFIKFCNRYKLRELAKHSDILNDILSAPYIT